MSALKAKRFETKGAVDAIAMKISKSLLENDFSIVLGSSKFARSGSDL